jgi:uncharacterized protein
VTPPQPMISNDPAGGVLLRVKVVPGARREEIAGVLDLPTGPRLKVRVSAPPEGGRANDAVCALLASTLGVHTRSVSIASGHTSPEKTVRVAGVDRDAAARALGTPGG